MFVEICARLQLILHVQSHPITYYVVGVKTLQMVRFPSEERFQLQDFLQRGVNSTAE